MEIPNDNYYQNMLKTLDDLPSQKKQKAKVVKEEGKYDRSSPFYYLYNSRALAAMEAKIEAEKLIEKNHQQIDREESRARYLSEKQAKSKRPNSNMGLIESILAMKITSSTMKQRFVLFESILFTCC